MGEPKGLGWHSGCVFTRVRTNGFRTVYVAMPGRELTTLDVDERRRRAPRAGTALP